MSEEKTTAPGASRRGIIGSGAGLALLSALPPAAATPAGKATAQAAPRMSSGIITTKDGVQLFYKDWGPKAAQPIVFHHGWPLTSDDWDAQMMFFLLNGYRVVAHDRRGHGR